MSFSWVVIEGSFPAGMTFVGPFKSHEQAIDYEKERMYPCPTHTSIVAVKKPLRRKEDV